MHKRCAACARNASGRHVAAQLLEGSQALGRFAGAASSLVGGAGPRVLTGLAELAGDLSEIGRSRGPGASELLEALARADDPLANERKAAVYSPGAPDERPDRWGWDPLFSLG
jgi:hypothetical protein